MKHIRKCTLLLICLLTAAAGLLACSSKEEQKQDVTQTEKQMNTDKNFSAAAKKLQPVKVTDTAFTRLSRTELQISWSDSLNPYVTEYAVLRKEAAQSDWNTVTTLHSDGESLGRTLAVTDTLPDDSMHQYFYRVDVTAASPDKYKGDAGEEIPATNLIICIDPGHFEGKNAITSDNLAYAEGDFNLSLASELEQTLKNNYGIISKLTRSTGSITIGGYKDQQLDSSHISLRGEFSENCDLFVSLHTNANLENAGGSPTEQQPISINKPIIFVNSVALDDPTALRIANEVGSRSLKLLLTKVSLQPAPFEQQEPRTFLNGRTPIMTAATKKEPCVSAQEQTAITTAFCAELLTYRFPVSSSSMDFTLYRKFDRRQSTKI